MQYSYNKMGISKIEYYNNRQIKLANIAKALAHPARIAIIDFLLKKKDCICNDIVNEIPLAQPTISQHLKELKQAGLIQGNIEGNNICYCIHDKEIDFLKNYLGKVIDANNKSKNCC